MTQRAPAPAPARPAARDARPATSPSPALPTTGITVYGCEPDEAVLFAEMAPRFGAVPRITAAPVSEANIGLALGHRCISIAHRTQVTSSALLALSQAGVTYISTRSAGLNHIDVRCAEHVGITVETVAYSPDSVADYTLMLMLMAVRHAQSVITRAAIHDYRLNDVRGRELRDLTVGVIGTGRIGSAVVTRLRGFGARTLAHDTRPTASASHVALGTLLEESDVVTLHTPLTEQTRHLLDRHRIEQMKQGAVIVNTGRGALIDTQALLSALESGSLGGAALDVVEGEEGIFYEDRSDRPPESQLLLRLHRLSNVIVSPHTAYHTDHALTDMVEQSILNCVKFESCQCPG